MNEQPIQDLQGKNIFVTGSSRGIGRETATLLHSRGATVVVHARQESKTTDSLLAQLGERVYLVTGDLSSPENTDAVWQSVVEAVGRVDVLVNNAGAWIASPVNDGEEWCEGWKSNIQLNLSAPAQLARLAIVHFQEHGGGAIINLVSRSAHRGDDAEHLAYGAAKGGLLALSKGIARGYGKQNILSYAIAPGWVATELAQGNIEQSALDALPLGEVTPAREVAEVIAFLSTGRARHVTGGTIDITGADYVR